MFTTFKVLTERCIAATIKCIDNSCGMQRAEKSSQKISKI